MKRACCQLICDATCRASLRAFVVVSWAVSDADSMYAYISMCYMLLHVFAVFGRAFATVHGVLSRARKPLQAAAARAHSRPTTRATDLTNECMPNVHHLCMCVWTSSRCVSFVCDAARGGVRGDGA